MQTVEFVESKKYPKSERNPTPSYFVSWELRKDGKPVLNPKNNQPKRTGNQWPSRAYAEEVYRRKLKEGLNPTAEVSYYAFGLSL